jgi:phosphohistidine phosphatase
VRDPRRWPEDDHRPLTTKGRKETRRAARGLARLVDAPGRIASSAAGRALATARLLRDELGSKTPVEVWDELASGRLAEPIFERLRRSARTGQEVVLVGHEPTLTEFVGLALVGEGIAVASLTKGGAACVEFPSSLRPGAGRLLWLLTRKQLAGVRG